MTGSGISEKPMTSICKVCGTVNAEDANFCRMCAVKLKSVCDCWVKKEPYNCGQDQCPGYRLFLTKDVRDQVASSEVHTQSQ